MIVICLYLFILYFVVFLIQFRVLETDFTLTIIFVSLIKRNILKKNSFYVIFLGLPDLLKGYAISI